MAPDNSELEHYYARFNRDHERLRAELVGALQSPAAAKRPFVRRFTDRPWWPALAARRSRWAGLVAAALVAVIALAVALKVGTTSVTYANVLERIAQTQTVRYTLTRTSAFEPPQVIRYFVRGRYQQRQEHLGADGAIAMIAISNLQTGDYACLDPRTKQCQILRRNRSIDLETGEVEVQEITPAPDADIYRTIREIPPDALPTFSERDLDGTSVIGFYQEKEVGVYLRKTTYWVDVETMLPVRIDSSATSTNPMWGSFEFVQSDFVFDEYLSPDLCSTEPPEGYSVEEGEIQGIKMPKE
jgi:hypothetical protein